MSNEITDETINKTIAEFTGGLWCHSCKTVWETNYFEQGLFSCGNCIYGEQKLYTNSLDSLVPIWEKLEDDRGFFITIDKYKKYPWWDVWVEDGFENKIHVTDDSCARAAALATYKAILEVNNG